MDDSRVFYEGICRKRYGRVYDAVMEQLPKGNFTINWIQMQKFLEIVGFFADIKEIQHGLWKEIGFDKGNRGIVATTYLVFDNDFDDDDIDMPRVLQNADCIRVFCAENYRACIECRVNDVLVGNSEKNSGKLPRVFQNDLLARPASDEEIENSPAMQELNDTSQALFTELGKFADVYDKYVPDGIFEVNEKQANKFAALLGFFRKKAEECGGEIIDVRAVPKEMDASFVVLTPEFKVSGGEVRVFCELIQDACLEICKSYQEGILHIVVTVDHVHIRKRRKRH